MNLLKNTIIQTLKQTKRVDAFVWEWRQLYQKRNMPMGTEFTRCFVDALRSTSPELNLLISSGQTITNGTANAVLSKLD